DRIEALAAEINESGHEATAYALDVTDRGPGLIAQEMERIGDRFWRSTQHQNIQGSGLGLSISQALLAAGGGSLSYAAHEPHGLRVTVSVPRNGPQG
ncbi:ATP-binding protein, partial [Streptomyces sp. NPDC059802]|uniref:sensor histidine kinase n=1 Tax=Streptomyces sp. NPDC059802 TaxID=3346952 RepID=UPI003667064D